MDNLQNSVSDKLLQGLYFQRDNNGAPGWGRITELIPDTSNWRNVADNLYEQGLIVQHNGGITHLTDKGIRFCETTSFLEPAIPIIKLENL